MCNDDKIIADFGAEDYNNWCIEKLKEDYNELKENNEKIKEETAIKMLNMNMSYDVIREIVGLSIDEIKELENNK